MINWKQSPVSFLHSFLLPSLQGSVLGPEEFLEGLGIGLRSFVGGTVGTCITFYPC